MNCNMKAISIVMPTYNASKYVAEAIDSVLQQSFEDWELLIIDDGSTDNTVDIIHSYTDSRIRLICNEHDFIGSLKLGLQEASGKYIARMDADDIMHPDRLNIQYNIMEEEPEITVCGSTVLPIVNDKIQINVLSSLTGVIDDPLLQLLKGNIIFHPTACIRRSFLSMNSLTYEPYMYAEDYKLWFEIAKKGGAFYVESLPLLFYRFSEQQVSKCKRNIQSKTSWKIKKEVFCELLNRNSVNDKVVCDFYHNLFKLVDKGFFTTDFVSTILIHLINESTTKSVF